MNKKARALSTLIVINWTGPLQIIVSGGLWFGTVDYPSKFFMISTSIQLEEQEGSRINIYVLKNIPIAKHVV